MIETIIFYLFAILIITAAVMMIRSINLVHSALFMVLTFLGIAGVYILLYADYLAVVQLLVYIGAISVMLVFGIMLTRRGDISKSNLMNNHKVAALLVSVSLFVIIVWSVISSSWKLSEALPLENTVAKIAELMMNDYVIPFEVAGVLLLVAMIGAIIIGKGVKNSK